jgi:uncharacterized membrane protein
MTAASKRPDPAALVAVLVAVVSAGVVLRFVTTSHLWLDEALSVEIARLPVRDIPQALRHDGHPPLYYALLHAWISLFGDSDVAVRSLSGVFGVALVPLGWFAGRRLGGRDAAWIVVAVLAVSPFAVRYATEARMYSLVMVLVMTGYLLLGRALERPCAPRLAVLSVTVGVLLLTHYWALWLVAATVVVLGWQWRHTAGNARRATGRALVAVVAGGLLFVPWLPSMLTQAAHTGTPWAATVRPTTMVSVGLTDIGGGEFAEGVLLGFALLTLAALGLLGKAVDARRIELDVCGRADVGPEAAVVVLTLAIASVASYATRTTFASRYLAVIFPVFVLLAALGVSRFIGSAPRRIVLGVVLVLGAAGSGYNVVTDRTQLGVIAGAVNARRQPDDVVVVCPDQLGPSTRRLLPDAHLLTYPDGGDGRRVDWYDYEERNATADPRAFVEQTGLRIPGRAVWLVASDSYKTLDGQCPALQALLSQGARSVESVVAQDGDTYFENAGLLRIVLGP